MGQGLAAPPPAHPSCCGAMEGLSAQGQVSAPSALPWPRLGLPKSPVGTRLAPDLCEASSSLSSSAPPPRGGQGAHTPPFLKSVHCRTPPAAGTSRGCPSWCREQQCPPPPLCPQDDWHAGLAWGAVAPPSSTPPSAPAAAGAGGGGSSLTGAYSASLVGASASVPSLHAGFTSAPSYRGKGGGGSRSGGGRGTPQCLGCRLAIPFSRAAQGVGGPGRWRRP